MKNSLNQNLQQHNTEVLNWELIQEDFKTKFGNDVFESWLKKMDLIQINVDHLLISVPTRFIRDWITSRYLDNVIQVIKSHNKKINLLIEKKDKKAALGYLPKLNSELMKIAKTGVIKKQNASRNVSRITKRINC